MRPHTGIIALALFLMIGVSASLGNDDCSDYIDLTPMALPLTQLGTTAGLTNAYGPFMTPPACWQGNNWITWSASGVDATYKWTAPADGEYMFSLCDSPSSHATLQLYQFTCPDEPAYPEDFICGCLEGCGPEGNGLMHDITLSDGQEVLIVVDCTPGNSGGAFELKIHDTTTLESDVEALMEVLHIPGMSTCIVGNGEVRWDGHFGMADIDAGRPVTDSTLFYIASVSKTVTGAALM